MVQAVVILALLLALLLAAAFLLGRHLSRRQYLREELSAVSRQHIDLFQGGKLSETALDSTKSRFRELLERGDLAAIEASLRPGVLFVVQVRALAELGTDAAGHILERQLHRRLSEDQIEQSWYWIDLANGLRSLNRSQSLPHLLRCAEQACERPLGHFFAAETVCFLGFSGYLQHELRTSLGRAALRTLHRALEGLRCGVPPQVVVEARIGEMIESLWDRRGEEVSPLMVRVFLEALRTLRRAPHAETLLGFEAAEQEAFSWQMARLEAVEPALADYLQEVPSRLASMLPFAGPEEQRDILLALIDLKADVSAELLPLLQQSRLAHPPLAISLLAWAKAPAVGEWLREQALSRVSVFRRSQYRRRSLPPRRPSLASELAYGEILFALRGHASQPTEALLLSAAYDWDPTYRGVALSSLGWWEPLQREAVLQTLQEGRRDPNPEVRQHARAALARLGERQALQWFRQTLSSEDPQRVHETIQLAATEGLMLLWPDLDRLADAEDTDIAHHAREALERLCEELDQSR